MTRGRVPNVWALEEDLHLSPRGNNRSIRLIPLAKTSSSYPLHSSVKLLYQFHHRLVTCDRAPTLHLESSFSFRLVRV